jgi:transcriptional regulator GlxA family with amidase domain
MAAEADMSPRQLNRRFRQLYGISPAAHLTKVRLDMARLLLTENDAHLRDIALAVGFRSDDSFRRAFERTFGISPSLYRRAFRTSS